MKKWLFFLLLLPIGLMAQKKLDSFTVKGVIKGVPDKTIIFLSNGITGQTYTTDEIEKGVFELKARVQHPTLMVLGFVRRNEQLVLFIGNENITIEGEISQLAAASIEGSTVNKDYATFKANFDPVKDKLNSLATTINQSTAVIKRDSLIGVFNQYKSKLKSDALVYLRSNPESAISAFALYAIAPLYENIADLEANFQELQPIAQKTMYGEQLAKTIADAKIGMVGSNAIDFTQNDVNNKPVSLSSFRGKYVLVDFWASWCRPCRMENPNVVVAYNAYKHKNFTVLGVSLDQDRNNWLQAIKADNLTWTHVSDLKYWNNAAAQLYRIQGIPANMLIDPNGKIIGRDLRGDDLQEKLKELFK